MESINNDKAGATTASYSHSHCAHKTHVSPFPPCSPVRYRSKEGTRRHGEAIRRSWRAPWVSGSWWSASPCSEVHGIVQPWCTFCGKLHKEAHCGRTAFQVLLVQCWTRKCWGSQVVYWPWKVWESLNWSETDHIASRQPMVSSMT